MSLFGCSNAFDNLIFIFPWTILKSYIILWFRALWPPPSYPSFSNLHRNQSIPPFIPVKTFDSSIAEKWSSTHHFMNHEIPPIEPMKTIGKPTAFKKISSASLASLKALAEFAAFLMWKTDENEHCNALFCKTAFAGVDMVLKRCL